jgi:flagellar basal body-associated protein FliL
MKLLIATLFAALSLSACVATPPVTPQSLTLNANQQTNLRSLLGLTPSSAFTVNVLDQNADRQLSPGDIAIMYGGIANTEISRRTLSVADVTSINADAALSE